MLIAKRAMTVTIVEETKGLLGHEIGDHVRSANKEGFYITTLSVMSAEVAAHVNVTSGRLVGRVQAHSDGTFVVAIQGGEGGVTETKCMEEHAEIKGFLGTFGQRIILRLLSAQADSGTELDLPTDAGSIEEEDVRARRSAKVKIGAPISVSSNKVCDSHTKFNTCAGRHH